MKAVSLDAEKVKVVAATTKAKVHNKRTALKVR